LQPPGEVDIFPVPIGKHFVIKNLAKLMKLPMRYGRHPWDVLDAVMTNQASPVQVGEPDGQYRS
jgi:hypothetical protein